MHRYLSLALVLFLAGCGGSNFSVSGKIELTSGEPLQFGDITLRGAGKSYSTLLKQNGTFYVSGVEKGDYTVVIENAFTTPNGTNSTGYTNPKGDYVYYAPKDIKPLIDSKYSDFQKSPLVMKVPGDYQLKVDPPATPKK